MPRLIEDENDAPVRLLPALTSSTNYDKRALLHPELKARCTSLLKLSLLTAHGNMGIMRAMLRDGCIHLLVRVLRQTCEYSASLDIGPSAQDANGHDATITIPVYAPTPHKRMAHTLLTSILTCLVNLSKHAGYAPPNTCLERCLKHALLDAGLVPVLQTLLGQADVTLARALTSTEPETQESMSHLMLVVELVAHLSTVPGVVARLHETSSRSVYAHVQAFVVPCSAIPELRPWALDCMHLAFQPLCDWDHKQSRPLRRCGNVHCVKSESRPKEFARCPRCKLVSYCG
jgi:hypothetical protein